MLADKWTDVSTISIFHTLCLKMEMVKIPITRMISETWYGLIRKS